MACQSSNPVIRHYSRLRAHIDLGAGSIKLTGQHVRAGQDPRNARRETLKFFPTTFEPEIECTMIYDEHERIHLGRKAVKAITNANPDELDNVLDMPKLALCYEYQDSPAVINMLRFLNVKSNDFGELQKVFTDIFKYIRKRLPECMLRSPSNARLPEGINRKEYWTDLPIELSISMPCHWDAVQRGILLRAASDAGFQDRIARSEALCGATDYILDYWERGELFDGNTVLFVDYGCSTTSVATITLKVTAQNDLILVAMGRVHEADAGGQKINDEAWKYILMSTCFSEYTDGFEGFLVAFGITKEECNRQFSHEFEKCKRRFPEEDIYSVTIRSSQKIRPLKYKTIHFEGEQIKRCFNIGLEKAKTVISRHLREEENLPRHVAILSGGGARNEYNRDCLEEHLERHGISLVSETAPRENPVANGALRLYLESEADGLPDRISFYIVMEGANRPKAPQILTLLYSIEPGMADESYCVPTTFNLSTDKSWTLQTKIFSSERKNRTNTNLNYKNGRRQPGLNEWPLSFTDAPDLRAYGYQPEISNDGHSYYNINCTVELSRTNDRLLVILKLLAPHEKFKFVDDDTIHVNRAVHRSVWQAEQELWAPNRSHKLSNGKAEVQHLRERKRPRTLRRKEDAGPVRKSPRNQVYEDASWPARLAPQENGDALRRHVALENLLSSGTLSAVGKSQTSTVGSGTASGQEGCEERSLAGLPSPVSNSSGVNSRSRSTNRIVNNSSSLSPRQEGSADGILSLVNDLCAAWSNDSSVE